MVDCLHCKEREWDLVGELENENNWKKARKCTVTIQYIIDGNYCEILASCRKRWPVELTTTFTRRLRPCVTMTVIPTATHPTSSEIL